MTLPAFQPPLARKNFLLHPNKLYRLMRTPTSWWLVESDYLNCWQVHSHCWSSINLNIMVKLTCAFLQNLMRVSTAGWQNIIPSFSIFIKVISYSLSQGLGLWGALTLTFLLDNQGFLDCWFCNIVNTF